MSKHLCEILISQGSKPVTLLNIFSLILFGCLTSLCAKDRGRSPVVWFLIGTGFALFGLVLLFLIPPLDAKGKEPEEIAIIEEKPKPQEEFLPPQNWFYLDSAKKTQGPLFLHELQELIQKGSITSESWVWHESMPQWTKIQKDPRMMKELFRDE
jgi:hypothetical protein